MAEIVLNVEVRERTGTGGARAARVEGKVPGILYGGKLAPVAIAVNQNEFKKALYTGKLLGHLVTLKYGKESQPVIAKDIQFHPVTDVPVHFDLYPRRRASWTSRSPSRSTSSQPGHLPRPEARRHAEHRLPRDRNPGGGRSHPRGDRGRPRRQELSATAVHISDLKLPKGAKATADGAVVVATVTGSSAQASEDAAADAAVAAEEARRVRSPRRGSRGRNRRSGRSSKRKTPPKADRQSGGGAEPC